MTSTGTSSDTTSNILENGQVPLPLADVDITEERRRRRERNAKDENAHDSTLLLDRVSSFVEPYQGSPFDF